MAVIFLIREVFSHEKTDEIECLSDFQVGKPRDEFCQEVVVRELLQKIHEGFLIHFARMSEGDHSVVGLYEIVPMFCHRLNDFRAVEVSAVLWDGGIRMRRSNPPGLGCRSL